EINLECAGLDGALDLTFISDLAPVRSKAASIPMNRDSAAALRIEPCRDVFGFDLGIRQRGTRQVLPREMSSVTILFDGNHPFESASERQSEQPDTAVKFQGKVS